MSKASDRGFRKISAEIILQSKSDSESSEISEYIVQRERDVYLTMKIEDDHLIHIRLSAGAARRIGEELKRISSEAE
ncbi:MAG: hypothetical protein OXN84_12340 [Albidovulum sp.]|nr:hypothetical protein [Albidovulum sp.]